MQENTVLIFSSLSTPSVMSNISDDTVLWESYPVHRSSDFITLPENRAELDYVSHDPLDTSDILNICTATVGVVGNSMTLLIIILR